MGAGWRAIFIQASNDERMERTETRVRKEECSSWEGLKPCSVGGRREVERKSREESHDTYRACAVGLWCGAAASKSLKPVLRQESVTKTVVSS